MATVLKEKIYKTIRGRVLSGKLQPGGRLSELALSKELGVSRTPVREAIGKLVHDGLAEYIPNEGTFLREPDRRDIREVYELRQCLECFAARQAALNATPEDIVDLLQACAVTRAMAVAVRQGEQISPEERMFQHSVHGDMAFHMALIRASGNSRAMKTIGNNHLLSQVWGYLHCADYSPDIRKLSWVYREHMRVVRCIERRDPDGAEAALTDHIRKGAEHVLGWFDKAKQKKDSEMPVSESWPLTVLEYDRQVERHL